MENSSQQALWIEEQYQQATQSCRFRVQGIPVYSPEPDSYSNLLEYAIPPSEHLVEKEWDLIYPRFYQATRLGVGACANRNSYECVVLSQLGLDDANDLKIHFSPDHEFLILHELEVETEGQVHQVEAEDFAFYPVGDSDQRKVLSQVWCLHIILPALRIGSRIRITWSRLTNLSKNNNFYSNLYPARYHNVGSYRVLYELLDDKTYIDFHLNTKETQNFQEVKTADSVLKYWNNPKVEIQDFEANGPSPVECMPTVYTSNVRNWTMLSNWLNLEFEKRGELAIEDLPDELRDIIQLEGASDFKISCELADWVRKNIQYFSISMGESGYLPRTPHRVLNKGWGDCKDKSLLLHSLLSLAGISSQMVLVNTSRFSGKKPPVPGLFFDHCILLVEPEGESILLDPTQAYSLDPRSIEGVSHWLLFLVNSTQDVWRDCPRQSQLCSEHIVDFEINSTGNKVLGSMTREVKGPASAEFTSYLSTQTALLEEECEEFIAAHFELDCTLTSFEIGVGEAGDSLVSNCNFELAPPQGVQLDSVDLVFHFSQIKGMIQQTFAAESRKSILCLYPVKIYQSLVVPADFSVSELEHKFYFDKGVESQIELKNSKGGSIEAKANLKYPPLKLEPDEYGNIRDNLNRIFESSSFYLQRKRDRPLMKSLFSFTIVLVALLLMKWAGIL